MSNPMNAFEMKNAAEKIEGYLIHRPTDKDGAPFERARAECLKHLQRQIDCVSALSREQFQRVLCRNSSTSEARV